MMMIIHQKKMSPGVPRFLPGDGCGWNMADAAGRDAPPQEPAS
jgi:hypothetical protein